MPSQWVPLHIFAHRSSWQARQAGQWGQQQPLAGTASKYTVAALDCPVGKPESGYHINDTAPDAAHDVPSPLTVPYEPANEPAHLDQYEPYPTVTRNLCDNAWCWKPLYGTGPPSSVVSKLFRHDEWPTDTPGLCDYAWQRKPGSDTGQPFSHDGGW